MLDSTEQDNVGVCFTLGRLRKLTLMPSIIIPHDAEVTTPVIQAWREDQREDREEGVFTV